MLRKKKEQIILVRKAELLPGEMARLIDEVKTLQALKGVFRYFRKAISSAYSRANRLGLLEKFKLRVNWESLSSTFIALVEERYPSSEKSMQIVSKLVDTMDELEAIHMKILVLAVMREAIKEMPPSKLYRSLQHRDDLYLAIIEASEDLEDRLEDLEGEMEEEEEEV